MLSSRLNYIFIANNIQPDIQEEVRAFILFCYMIEVNEVNVRESREDPSVLATISLNALVAIGTTSVSA